jgi:hypothetical protein
MQRSRIVLATVAVLMLGVAVTMGSIGTAVAAGSANPKEVQAKDFGRAHFSNSGLVNNKWLPLKPGTQLVFKGATTEDKERIPHQVIFTVTDLVKVVGGVKSVVIWDRDYADGKLVEDELSFMAQDDSGNVWHTGEVPREWEEGKIVASPAWVHGVKGAYAGIVMRVQPRVGTPSYQQGFAPPPVNWTDRSQIHKMGIKNCVPFRCFQNVLVIREFNPDEPGKSQLKYYASGLGNIRVGWLGNDPGKEVLELVEVRRLTGQALAKARAEALKIEAHAYKTKKAVYGGTQPAEKVS